MRRPTVVGVRYAWGPSVDRGAIIDRCHECGEHVWIDRFNASLVVAGAHVLCALCWNPELGERIRRRMAPIRAAALS